MEVQDRARMDDIDELLGPFIQQILDDKSLQINTNPVEVYKLRVDQLDRESGNPAGLNYDVSKEVALQYEEVQKMLEKTGEVHHKLKNNDNSLPEDFDPRRH